MDASGVPDLSDEESIPEQLEEVQQHTIVAEADGRDSENKFQKAISAWRNIDLTNLIPTLDTTAADLVTHQRDALVERKELAQKTKDWRKLEDAAKLAESRTLLKAYQTYIDLISNQSKAVNAAFMQVYSSFSEAPDPYPLLEASVDSLVVADETLPRLEAERNQLQTSLARLTSQLEETEAALDKERRSRVVLEESAEQKTTEVEQSWSAVLKEKQDNWEARERSLEERADNQERLLKELKASYEVAQRLEGADNSTTNNNGVSAAELEIVNSELERVHTRLADVESRNEQLRLELAHSTSRRDGPAAVEDDPSFLRLRSENSSLLRRGEAARLAQEKERRDWDSSSRAMRKEVAALKEDADSLKAKLARWSDYEDVKQELDILKSIEFSTGDGDEEHQHSGNGGEANGKDGKQNLEQLLLGRNKKLNNELTVLRVSHRDLAGRLDSLQEELSSTNMELEKSRNLTATLENDLEKLQSEAAQGQPAMSVAGTFTSRYPVSSWQSRRGRVSPTSSIISGMDSSPAANTLESLRAGESAVGGGSGILPMITAQRDRFKKRITELEGENSKNYQIIGSLRSEVASLQKDNLNLYEKTRYVSTYSRGASQISPTYPSSSSVQLAVNEPMDRYKSAYESRISPFAAFRGRESARAFRRMSLPERGVFQITRMVLATRMSRNLFALYCLGLHLLIIFMLYYTGTADIEKHAVHLADSSVAMAARRALQVAEQLERARQTGETGSKPVSKVPAR